MTNLNSVIRLKQWVSAQRQTGKLYAVLATNSESKPLSHYAQYDGQSTLIWPYQNTPYSDWQQSLPYLVEIDPDSPFLDWIGQTSSRDWGWLAWSSAPITHLIMCLQRLTKVELPDGDNVFFRYWQGNFFRKILTASTPTEQIQLLPEFSSLWLDGDSFILPIRSQLPAFWLEDNLVLTSAQLRLLTDDKQKAATKRLYDYFVQKYPKRARALGTDNVMGFITLMQARFSDYQITRWHDMTLYLDFACYLGSYFDTDPMLVEHVQPYLSQAHQDLTSLMELNRLMGEQFSRVLGAELKHYLAALERLQHYSIDSLPHITQPHQIIDFVLSLYPEKVDQTTELNLYALYQQNQSFFQQQLITSYPDQTIIMAIQFFLGHRFFDDPLYPWAAIKLEDYPIDSFGQRNLKPLVDYAQRRARKEQIMINFHLAKNKEDA